MADLKTLVSNYFEPKESFGLESLFQMIQETRFANQLFLEDEGVDPGEEKTFNIVFPKIRITENFGKIGTEDRQIIEKFAKNIIGSTLEEKIASLNSILTVKKEDASIGEILSTMVMCEILSAIITPPDLISQIIVGVPIALLYEAGILVSSNVEKKMKNQEIKSS